MIRTAGYRVRLPLFLGEIGPAASEKNNSAINVALEQEIKDLRKMLGNIQLNTAAIESKTETSGVEEIKPLGYDCITGVHEVDSAPAVPQSFTPSKRRNRDVLLTPVKGTSFSQPQIQQRPSDSPTTEDQEDTGEVEPFKRTDS